MTTRKNSTPETEAVVMQDSPSANGQVRACQCGCGQEVGKGSKFRQGHDSVRKSALLKASRGVGEAASLARAELLARNWATDEQIDRPAVLAAHRKSVAVAK